MLISEFLRALEKEVPLIGMGYSRDALGLQAGLPSSTKLTAALLAYEVTEEVIAEAVERNANLIVAFHPLIFPSIDGVTDATRTGALLRDLIKQDIALYIQHTAFDTHPEFGTSRLMAEALELKDICTLAPNERRPSFVQTSGNPGMGAIGTFSKSVSREELLRVVANTFGTPILRSNRNGPERIQTVALLGGAGMEYYHRATLEKANAFITADVRYHDFYRADHDNILLVDAGHAETERFVAQGMVRAARNAITNLPTQKSVESLDRLLLLARCEPNAVSYFG